MIEKKLFGTLSDGREVYAYTLKNANGMSAKILSYGGAIAEIRVPIETVALPMLWAVTIVLRLTLAQTDIRAHLSDVSVTE